MNDASKEIFYDTIVAGDKASFSVTITEKLINEFAGISGDVNPLHVDENYASRTHFGGRIAHGMIVGALFSRLIGMHLPGKYSLYLSQTLRFHNPIPCGAEIIVRGEVTHKTDAAKTIIIRTTAEDKNSGKILTSGEAMVQLLK